MLRRNILKFFNDFVCEWRVKSIWGNWFFFVGWNENIFFLFVKLYKSWG